MNVLRGFKLLSQFRNDRFGKRHGSVFLPFPVMNGQDAGIEIEAMHTKIQALEKTKPATVKQFDHQVIRGRKVRADGVYFLAGQHHGDVRFALCPNNAVDCSELLAKNVAKEKQEPVERLVLRR